MHGLTDALHDRVDGRDLRVMVLQPLWQRRTHQQRLVALLDLRRQPLQRRHPQTTTEGACGSPHGKNLAHARQPQRVRLPARCRPRDVACAGDHDTGGCGVDAEAGRQGRPSTVRPTTSLARCSALGGPFASPASLPQATALQLPSPCSPRLRCIACISGTLCSSHHTTTHLYELQLMYSLRARTTLLFRSAVFFRTCVPAPPPLRCFAHSTRPFPMSASSKAVSGMEVEVNAHSPAAAEHHDEDEADEGVSVPTKRRRIIAEEDDDDTSPSPPSSTAAPPSPSLDAAASNSKSRRATASSRSAAEKDKKKVHVEDAKNTPSILSFFAQPKAERRGQQSNAAKPAAAVEGGEGSGDERLLRAQNSEEEGGGCSRSCFASPEQQPQLAERKEAPFRGERGEGVRMISSDGQQAGAAEQGGDATEVRGEEGRQRGRCDGQQPMRRRQREASVDVASSSTPHPRRLHSWRTLRKQEGQKPSKSPQVATQVPPTRRPRSWIGRRSRQVGPGRARRRGRRGGRCRR